MDRNNTGLGEGVHIRFPLFLLLCAFLGFIQCVHDSGGNQDKPDNVAAHLDTTYWPNGAIMSIATWKAGKRDGVLLHKYDNGNVEAVAHYKDGKQVGWNFSWHRDGAKSTEWYMKDGANFCHTYWDDQGNVEEKVECPAELYSDSTYSDWKVLAKI